MSSYLTLSLRYDIASPTVAIFSASSSGIETLNSFSNSIINSTVSRESAPRSLVKLAESVISDYSIPNLSIIISFILFSRFSIKTLILLLYKNNLFF